MNKEMSKRRDRTIITTRTVVDGVSKELGKTGLPVWVNYTETTYELRPGERKRRIQNIRQWTVYPPQEPTTVADY